MNLRAKRIINCLIDMFMNVDRGDSNVVGGHEFFLLTI